MYIDFFLMTLFWEYIIYTSKTYYIYRQIAIVRYRR